MPKLSAPLIILVLWLAGLCAAAQFAKIGHFLPELQLLYPEADSALGFLLSLISLVGALLGLVAGVLVGRIGSRSVLLTGLWLGAMVSFVQSFNLPLDLLLASRVLEGVSHLAIVVAAPTLIAHYSSERLRAAAMTLWGTFFGVSFALTAWLGLPLVTAKGIDALFFAHGLIMGATALLATYVITGLVTQTATTISGTHQNITHSTQATGDSHHKAVSFSLSGLYQQHKRAWLSPYIAAPAAGWLFYTLTFVALIGVLPGLMPDGDRAFTAAVLPVASIISSMTLGIWLLRHYTAIQVLAIGFIAAIVCIMVMLSAPDKPLIAVLLFAALGLVQGASFTAIPQLNENGPDQALANGAMAQAGNIGNLCGMPLLLILLSSGGTPAMFVTVIFCYIAALITHLIFARRRRVSQT